MPNATARAAVPSDRLLKRVVDNLKLIGDPTRIRIVLCLMNGPKNVTQLVQYIRSQLTERDVPITQHTISHHLSILRHNHMITNLRRGKEVHYTLNEEFLDQFAEQVLEVFAGPDKSEWRAGRFLLRRGAKPTPSPAKPSSSAVKLLPAGKAKTTKSPSK